VLVVACEMYRTWLRSEWRLVKLATRPKFEGRDVGTGRPGNMAEGGGYCCRSTQVRDMVGGEIPDTVGIIM
jgi:hypothetical protein